MVVIKDHLTLSVWFSTGVDWLARFCFLSWPKEIPFVGSAYGCRECCLISSQRLAGFFCSCCSSILFIRGESNSSFRRIRLLPLVSRTGGVLSNSKKIDGKILYVMWCFAQFGTFCTILRKWKHPLEECYFYCYCWVLLLLQDLICNFNKSNTPPWVFFTFLNWIKGIKSRKTSHIPFI